MSETQLLENQTRVIRKSIDVNISFSDNDEALSAIRFLRTNNNTFNAWAHELAKIIENK